ncbi:uncharacterized protein TNCV_2536311 [Trichonephila clavipes]|nr:uncharacterized protein TNCV_2536311 [Trichonephila clavipes]
MLKKELQYLKIEKKVGEEIGINKEQVEEIGRIKEQVEDLEKMLLACGNEDNEIRPEILQGLRTSADETKLQKTGESLHEYAFEVERLTNLAFSDHPATVREIIPLQYFVDGLKKGEIQKTEAATQASRRDRHSIRGARVTADELCKSRCIQKIEKLKEEMQALMAKHQNHDKRNFKCWGCGGTGHMRRNLSRGKKEENTDSSSKQEN